MSEANRNPGLLPEVVFLDEHRLRVGNVEFHCQFPLPELAEGELGVMKPRALVERYMDLCAALRPERIVELGIRRGGSTALLAELTHPRTLVAFELADQPAPALSKYVHGHGMESTVCPHYGVDQADAESVLGLLEADLGDQCVDLVIDDASHLYQQTLTSFEALFPRLRDGGLYVIEDWRWAERRYDALVESLRNPNPQQMAKIDSAIATGERRPRPVPLSRLLIELVLVHARREDIISRVSLQGELAVIERGSARLDSESFSVAALYVDHFGFLASTSSDVRPAAASALR